MPKNKTVVRVAGREYTMISEEPPEYILRVAAFVDRKMEELNAASKLSNVMLATLTAMNVADELLKAQDDNARMRKDLAEARQQMSILQRENTSIKEKLRQTIDDIGKH